VESRVIEHFAPAHVVVNRDGEVVHFSTRTGKYLENAAGAPARNLLSMARRGLRLELRTALIEAVETRRVVRRSAVRVEVEDRVQTIDLAIEPLPDHDAEPLFLVVFTDLGPLGPEQVAAAVAGQHAAGTEQLERELRDSHERLQSFVEEYETALEELKSANEELVSINEELQSTNEELETSREEAQSVNEELNTVNSELQRKVEELDRANDNLRNLFEGTEIATVFLDRNLVIRSFTPAIRSIFNLMEIDRGRPLTDIVSELEGLDLHAEIDAVLAAGQPRERRVMRRDGNAHYLMRTLPYRTADRAVDGILITFTDVTRLTEIEEYQQELNKRTDTMLQRVIAISERSLSRDAAAEILLGRLHALRGIYALVAQANWGDVAVADLIARELASYGIGRNGRVVVVGQPVLLKAEAAVGIGMALHELTVNAARRGALSQPQGRVHLDWAIEGENAAPARLVLNWREAGGPAVKPDGETGLGPELLSEQLRQESGVHGELEFAADGIEANLSVPLSSGLVVLPGGAQRRQAR
jgi:two-component system CheB/CheR fusion protein